MGTSSDGYPVRSGMSGQAGALPEPVPDPDAAEALREWLTGAAGTASTPEAETLAARRLDAVAEIMGMRRSVRR
ncbi:hypothetical protein ACF09H_34285 [Streptomyces sp. NPDC014983]|uniref:hypothetical protein n=1 Tax=Streptomyces sp. NPDC014983 TaxID=3364933 RepID=UPI0036FF639F